MAFGVPVEPEVKILSCENYSEVCRSKSRGRMKACIVTSFLKQPYLNNPLNLPMHACGPGCIQQPTTAWGLRGPSRGMVPVSGTCAVARTLTIYFIHELARSFRLRWPHSPFLKTHSFQIPRAATPSRMLADRRSDACGPSGRRRPCLRDQAMRDKVQTQESMHVVETLTLTCNNKSAMQASRSWESLWLFVFGWKLGRGYTKPTKPEPI